MDKDTQRFIANLLREGTIKYWGRTQALNRYRRRVRNKDGTWSNYRYPCAKCKGLFDIDEVEVDHIDPVGPFKGIKHLEEYARRMYRFGKNAQVLCVSCHKAKTTGAATTKYTRRKK